MTRRSYRNATVFTGTGEHDFAEAFTMVDGVFTWVGASADAPPDAIDLGGATVLPGLLDVHTHPAMLAELVDKVSLLPPAVTSVAAMLEALRTHANCGKGPDDWIEGFGFNESAYSEGAPTRHDLDRVSTSQPVFALRADVHTAVVNSLLLERAGITRDTPDPDGGRFQRDAAGEPNGVLEEFSAQGRVLALKPPRRRDDLVRRVVALNEHFGRLGLVAVDDMLASEIPDCLSVFREAAEAGYYPQTGLFLQWDAANGLPDVTEDDRTGRIRVAGVKLLLDGAYSNRTASTLDPYPGTSDDYGVITLPHDQMVKAVEWARANRVQAALHAMGDRAITAILDTFGDWEPWLGDRPSIVIQHATLFSPEMIDRCVTARMTFGVVSHTIFFFAEYDDYAHNLSRKQFEIAYPIRSFYDRVPATALASDAPATAWADCDNVFTSVKAAVVRRAHHGTDIGQSEAITVGRALELYTGRAAMVTTAADVGTIEVGKEASFVILDRDVFTIPAEEIDQVQVTETWVGGQRVWKR